MPKAAAVKPLKTKISPSAAVEKLRAENEELRRRLEEAEETISAIRTGAVDALVVEEPGGHRIYTLEGAERPYRLFIEEMQQGAATLHPDGTIAWCNAQLAKLLKVPQEKLLGAPLHDFIAIENRAAYDNLLWQGQTRSGRGEAQLRCSDDGLLPAFLTFNALPKVCGAAIGVLVTDLTTQRHHEELTEAHAALRAAEQEVREFLENASVAMHWVGPDGIILWANQTELDLLGYTHAEYIGRHINEFHADPPVIEDVLSRLAKGDTLRNYEARLRRKDGSIRHVLIDANALFENGKFVHTRCFTRDVTEHKQAEEALRESEERFRSVANSSPALIWQTDATGVTFVNRFYLEFFGQPFEAVAGMGWAGFLHPDDYAGYVEAYRSAFERQARYEYQCRFRRHDGEYRWLHNVGSPHRGPNGEFLGFIGSSTDITDMKRAEEALRESEQRFRLMADAVPVLIWVSDTTKGCIWFNKCWRDFSGRPMEELLGDGWARDVHPDDVERCMNIYSARFDAREPFSMEYRMKRHDGEYRWVLDNGIPRFEADGAFAGYIGACSDFTERQQAEAARARLAAIVESSDDAIISKDLNGTITSWNRGAERLFGYTAQEAVGHPVTMLIPPDHLNEEPGILARIRRGEAMQHYETVRRRKDGTLFNISLTVSPIRNSEGQVIGASKVARDITERKRAEEALRRASEFDEAVMTNMGEGLYTVDREGVVTFVNPAAEKLFGWTGGELMGRRMHDVTHFKHRDGTPFPAEQCSGFQVLKHGKSLIDHEDVFIRKDGTFFDVVYSSAPLREGDEIVGLVVVFRDVTERKQAEEALRAAQLQLQEYAHELEARVAERTARLQETVGELEAYSYSIAHDMRAPLRAMTSFARLVETEHGAQLDETGRGYLGRVVSAAQRLDRLVTDVLTYSRVSRMKLDVEPVDLDKLFDEAIRNQPEFQLPRAEIEIQAPLPRVIAHEPSLMQCVNNLLSNAVKFVSPGVVPHVRIRSEVMNDEVRIWFEDNGIGIAAADMPRIFSLFGRLHPAAAFDGTGIGLTIVRKAVQRMGGAVGVESEPGRGSRFWIQLRRSDEE